MTRRKQKKESKRSLWADDPDYQRWINYLFDRDDPTGEWRFKEPTPPLTEAQIVYFIHRLCATADTELARFSDVQIAHGLHFVFNDLFEYAYVLRDSSVALELRLNAIAALATLFRECLNVRCSPGSRLSEVCWMFWDVTPLIWCERNPNKTALYTTIAEVMRQCLNLSNMVCVKSALHGLGHLRSCYPEAAGIVRHFLNTTQRTDPNLLRYAEAAEQGRVQ